MQTSKNGVRARDSSLLTIYNKDRPKYGSTNYNKQWNMTTITHINAKVKPDLSVLGQLWCINTTIKKKGKKK